MADTSNIQADSLKRISVALAGNPNSGKTTIFNNLTGARQHVGNYPGVTVEKKDGRFTHQGHEVQVIYSSRRDLDVLPVGVDKGSAAARLASQFGFLTRDVIVAGDTGNDAAMFLHGFRGIVVGNAHVELKSLQSPEVYQSNSSYADGVLEGLQHWLQPDLAAAKTAAESRFRSQ